MHRNVALNGIREQLNPFDFQSLAKKPKFEVTIEHGSKGGIRRPGEKKSREEEAVCLEEFLYALHC